MFYIINKKMQSVHSLRQYCHYNPDEFYFVTSLTAIGGPIVIPPANDELA